MNRKWGWIIGILVFAFLIRLIFLFKNPALWWDSAVYIGMAKYIFSAGQMGLWEYFRPLLWPLVLGIGWKLGANIILFGKILEILFSLAIIFFAFEIARRIFNIKIAIFSSLLLAVNPLFFEFSHILYNEIPALFFGIFSVYLFILYREKRAVWTLILSGVLSACAFLARFPTGLIFGSIFVLLLAEFLINLIKEKNLAYKDIAVFTASFIISTIPFFIFNYIIYNGNFLYPINGALKVINEILVTAPEFNTKWYYYIITLFQNSFIFVFAVLGLIILIYFLVKKFNTNNKLLLILLLALPFAYYQINVFKDLRYAIAYLPFLYIISVYGLYRIAKIKTIIPKIIVIAVIIIAFVISLSACYETVKFLPEQQPELNDYYSYLSGEQYYGNTVISTTPYILPYSDIKLIPLYAAGARTMDADFEKALSKYIPSHIVFSESDVPCSDELCYNKRARTLELIKENFEQVYHGNHTNYIFSTGLEKRNSTQLVVFRMDDVGEPRNFKAYEKINSMFVENAIPLNWLVIPMRFKYNLTQEQKDYLIEEYASGWFYVIQHGYWHETELENTEFKGLDYKTQYEQIKEGKQMLEDYFSQDITSFSPPYNSADMNTIKALKNLGFDSYLTAHWDAIEIQGLNRYNSDMQFITDWTPPYPIRSFEELKSDFDALENQNIVIIEFHPHRFYKDEDFKTLNKFIKYVKSKQPRFVHLYELK